MKRIRLWLSNFTLVQQFLTVAFLTISILVIFVSTYLNNNIDTFVDRQMYEYIHTSQKDFLDSRANNPDDNAMHFVYDVKNQTYLNKIDDEYSFIIDNIDPNSIVDSIDSNFTNNDTSYLYSVITFGENFKLVSILKNNYRNEVRSALLNGVVYVTLYVVAALIFLILLWVMSLIRPLNSIKSYINRIRDGEKSELDVGRSDEIGQVAEALSSMNKQLAQQQHIRDEMIQNISHDLKTPIATIKSYSESIKDGIYPYDTLEKSVDVISENADRLEKKVYSLITYNKLGYLTNDESDIANLEMSPIISKAILACSVLRNDVKIETFLDDDIYFHGDEEPWRVVVENLLDNALRYAQSVVRISLSKNTLEVYNDGPNMDEDRLSKLFKPYEKGTNGKFGLGLSIVKKVTETYGYNVVGENMPDGVVFRIYTNKKFKKPIKKKAKKV